jgi:hypothetical protein
MNFGTEILVEVVERGHGGDMINIHLYAHMHRKLGNPFKIFGRSF